MMQIFPRRGGLSCGQRGTSHRLGELRQQLAVLRPVKLVHHSVHERRNKKARSDQKYQT